MTAESGSLGFYICGFILLAVCALKVPALVQRRHDMLLRAACIILFTAGSQMIIAAPETIVALNRHTGIMNVAAPTVYAITVAFSGASLLLIINWRPAPPEKTRQASRLCITAYSLGFIAVILLFWAGNAPVEQVTLFDAYYANTPYIREMIVLYLVAQAVAMMTASILCWRWSREVHGSLRTGLRLLAPAYLIIVCYDSLRLVAVASRWMGYNLDFLVDEVSPPLAGPASLLGAIGFIVPLAGPRLAETAQSVRQLRQLAPLWRALRDVPTPGAIRMSLPWWRTPPEVLLTVRKTALYDAIHTLSPYCDPAVRESAYRVALRRGADQATAAITGEAAVLLDARNRLRAAPDTRLRNAETPEKRASDLIPLSQALNSSIVRDLHEDLVPHESSPS
ncbi:MAB_1171c family putative transporter [Streptomyces bobili]|uniref:MAB_1171c family putative transporter n=1 Tax=Streptomyces bobili TaxID=67280 RepID=UPI003423F8E4